MSNLIPKHPDLVEWFLIGRHSFKQWSDHNYDFALHVYGTGKEQDLSFEMACFQGCADYFVLLLCAQTDSETRNTHPPTHTHTHTQTHKHNDRLVKV